MKLLQRLLVNHSFVKGLVDLYLSIWKFAFGQIERWCCSHGYSNLSDFSVPNQWHKQEVLQVTHYKMMKNEALLLHSASLITCLLALVKSLEGILKFAEVWRVTSFFSFIFLYKVLSICNVLLLPVHETL